MDSQLTVMDSQKLTVIITILIINTGSTTSSSRPRCSSTAFAWTRGRCASSRSTAAAAPSSSCCTGSRRWSWWNPGEGGKRWQKCGGNAGKMVEHDGKIKEHMEKSDGILGRIKETLMENMEKT